MGYSNSKLRRITVPLCALALLVGAILLPRSEIKPRMKVALSVWPGSEALVLARDAGKLPSNRIRLIELPWSSAVTRTFDDGGVDVAVLTLDLVIQLRAKGQKLRVIRVLDQSTGGDAIIARHPIKTAADLKGKRVGIDLQGTGLYPLIDALEHGGLSLADVEIVPLIQPDIESLFIQGGIDAAAASTPWLTKIRADQTRVLFDSSSIKVPVIRLIVASERACHEFAPELRQLVRAATDMTTVLRSGREFPGVQSVLRREKITIEEFFANLDGWQPVSATQNTELLAGQNPRLELLAKEMEEQLVRHGVLASRPPATPWIDPQFLPDAWP